MVPIVALLCQVSTQSISPVPRSVLIWQLLAEWEITRVYTNNISILFLPIIDLTNSLMSCIKLTCTFVNFKLLSSLNKLLWLFNSENTNILTEICGFRLESHRISNKWWSVLYYLNSYYYMSTLFVSCIYAPLWVLLWLIKNLNLYLVTLWLAQYGFILCKQVLMNI